MKLDRVIIEINEYNFLDIQNNLFKLGFSWRSGNLTKYDKCNFEYLYLNNNLITHCSKKYINH